MVTKKTIAIIPARGGSKRIPKKNIIDFFGKPIISYTIENSINSKVFNRIIVSTDSEEIAEISKIYGAEAPFLRIENADDKTPVSEATLFSLNQAEAYYGEKYDIVAQLMPNCPIRNKFDIIKAYQNFLDKDYDSQISCFKFNFMNPWWAFKMNSDYSGEKLFKDALKQRSQDLDELYCPTGAIWFAKCDILKKTKTFYSPEYKYFEIDWKSGVDIDNYDDLEFAKAVMLMNKEKPN